MRMAAALALLLGATACTPAARTDEPPMVAVVMKSLANGFFATMAAGATADQATRPHAYRLVLNGTRNESDLAQQVALIDAMIAKRVAAIVVAPTDSKAIVPALARARAAGIVVVNIDNRLDAAVLKDYGIRIPYVGPDNRAGAALAGAVLAKRLAPGDQVAILEGITTADNSRARRQGLEDAARAAKLAIVSEQSADWDQTKAAQITAALLIRYPQLKAVLCANDSMALGAASAVGQAGKTGKVLVSGFDNLPATKPLIASGAMVSTADQHADKLVIYGIDYALAAVRTGGSGPDRRTPVDIITREPR